MDSVERLKLSNIVAMRVINNNDYPINGTTKLEIVMENGHPTDIKVTNSNAKATKKKEA